MNFEIPFSGLPESHVVLEMPETLDMMPLRRCSDPECCYFGPQNSFPTNGSGGFRSRCHTCYKESRRKPKGDPLKHGIFSVLECDVEFYPVVIDVLKFARLLRPGSEDPRIILPPKSPS